MSSIFFKKNKKSWRHGKGINHAASRKRGRKKHQFFCPRLTAFSPRRCGGFASVLPSSALLLSDARGCWFTFISRTTGLRAAGVMRWGLTRLSWVSPSLSGCLTLALCVLIIPHFWRFVKTFFNFFAASCCPLSSGYWVSRLRSLVHTCIPRNRTPRGRGYWEGLTDSHGSHLHSVSAERGRPLGFALPLFL